MSSAKRKHAQRRKRSKSAFLNSKNFESLSQQAQGSCPRFASQSFSSLDRSHSLLKTNNSRSTRRPFRYRSLSTFQVATASQYPLKPLSFSEWRRTPTTDTPIIYDRNKVSASRKSLKRHQAITHKIAYYTHPSYKFQTAYDALPYLNGQAIYKIQGNLQIIFKHYASLSNAHSIVQWKRSTFHEIKSESSLLSVLNLLYFCNDL